MYFSLAEKSSTLVRCTVYKKLLSLAHLITTPTRKDFLAVRKIPIRKQPVIQVGGILPAQGSCDPELDDLAVTSFLSRIRDTVLTDRALHDKVLGAISKLCAL